MDALSTAREDIKEMRVKLDKGAFMPERAHILDAGYDIKTPVSITVPPFTAHNGPGKAVVYTGIHVEIPKGYAGFVKSKSGLNLWDDILTTGLIDAGYSGQIVVKLYNHGITEKHFEVGDKITQLVIQPIFTPDLEQVEELAETERGSNGFGSTGA